MLHRRSALLALLPVLIAGCGGSGGSGHKTSTGDRVGPKITIAWPAQTRDFAAPAYTNAARIVFPNSGGDNFDLSQVVTRPAGTTAVNQTVLLDFAVSPGNHLVRVEFLADASSNTPLATASLNLNVARDGVLRTLEGKPLGTVAYTSQIIGLSVSGGQEIEVGTTTAINVTAATATGVTALPPGAVTLAMNSGASLITINPDGTVTGVAPGEVTLTPSIEGLAGSPASVTVLPAPIAARLVSISTEDLIFDPARGALFAALTSAGQNSNTVARVDPATGTLGTRIGLSGSPSVLALSDDGSVLYAGLRDASKVAKIDTATNTVLLDFLVPNSGFNSPAYAEDIDVQPGHPNTVALTRHDLNDSGSNGPAVFDDGVKRPNEEGIYDGEHLAWTSASTIVSYMGFSPPSGLRELAVDAQGVTLVRAVATSGDQSHRIVVAGGRIYARNGVVTDAITLSPVGTFALGGSFGTTTFGPAVDLTRRRAYFVSLTGPDSARLLTFNIDTLALVSTRRISGLSIDNIFASYGDSRVVLAGPDRVAFRLPDQVVFLDNVGS